MPFAATLAPVARRAGTVLLLVGPALAVALAVLALRFLAGPVLPELPADDPAVGLRVQHVVAQVLLREAGLSARADPLAITPAEASVFLARHVRVADPPAWPLRVGLGPGWIELEGPTSLGRLATRAGFSTLARVLPAPVRDRPVWLAVKGRLVAQSGRGELVAAGARIGRQAIPVGWLWRLLGGPPRSVAWAMPSVVERVEVTPEALVIHTRPRPPGRRAPA